MPDIYHDIPFSVSGGKVFEAVSTSEGLSKWWSDGGVGEPVAGTAYDLDFGPEYQWKAEVEDVVPGEKFSLTMSESDDDWNGTTISFEIEDRGEESYLRFSHTGWPKDNDHYRSSSYCWAMYLRCLKRYVENGVVLPYERRFNGE